MPILGVEPSTRQLPDWINAFVEYSKGLPSPEIFRLWSGITGVAGALEKRVWTRTRRDVYANLYTMLVGPPAVGKTEAIQPVADLWKAAKLKIAPDSVTAASLVDALAEAKRRLVLSDSQIMEFNSLVVPATEMGVLLPSHDLEFLNKLNRIYDTPPFHRETRRTSVVKDLQIVNPQMTILGGTQPSYLATLLPEQAWGMGFMSRQIMVYSAVPVKIQLFSPLQDQTDFKLWKLLKNDLVVMTRLYGALTWHPEAASELERWYADGLPPIPEHSKLAHYNGRRILHILKLCMIASISRSNDLIIELEDLQRARDWLLDAEHVMPDVFKDMSARSDAQVILDMHFFLWRHWVKTGQKPIHKSMLVHFLQAKVPSEKIQRVIDAAEGSNIIARVAGTTDRFVPRPRHEHGEEG